jgi:large subunit ribosomal protein L5
MADAKKSATATVAAPPPRLAAKYKSEVVKQLMERFSLTNVHEVPRLEKIVVSMGVGKAIENRKRLDAAANDMTTICGQRAQIRKAKVSVSGFKLRQDMPIGCRVTLRGGRMWEFLDRLITLAIPRIRDFRGIKRGSFDGRGNFSMGLTDQLVFPEISIDKVEWQQGMNITCVMSGGSDEMSFELLNRLGMPFRRD